MRAGGEDVLNYEGTVGAQIGEDRILAFNNEEEANEVRDRYVDEPFVGEQYPGV